MSTLQQLTAARDELLVKIKTIEENEHNKSIEKIFKAIKNQRWYFFKNKPHVLMDKLTGILWANLDYFPYKKGDGKGVSTYYTRDEALNMLNNYEIDNFKDWVFPSWNTLKFILMDKTFPFISYSEYWFHSTSGCIVGANADNINYCNNDFTGTCHILPCNYSLVKNSKYAHNIYNENSACTKKERLQFILDLFIKNKLEPIFNDEAITDLYKKIYFEKPRLIAKLQEIQNKIDSAQLTGISSTDFDYTALLSHYDIKAIDSSVIKYYKAIQIWIDDLINHLEHYATKKESLLKPFHEIIFKLQNHDNTYLTDEENKLMNQRQQFCRQHFTLSFEDIHYELMYNHHFTLDYAVKKKLLNVRAQADALEDKLEKINNSNNSLKQLAKLEKKPRVGFALLAENTAEILKSSMAKIDFFEYNQQLIENITAICKEWTEDYAVFATKRLDEFRQSCESDDIIEDIYTEWCDDWRKLRFAVEDKIQSLIKRSLAGDIPMIQQDKSQPPVVLQLINLLKTYKQDIDAFYLDGRKSIYLKYEDNYPYYNNELLHRLAAELELYKRTSLFQKSLKDIIFNCQKVDDRIFILQWANDILDWQLDEIFLFLYDAGYSKTILAPDDITALKCKSSIVLLNDAAAYTKEQSCRSKKFNDLILKTLQRLKNNADNDK